jgi:hypothetical protein
VTKLRHERPYREADPGAVVSVPDVTKPYKPPKTAADRLQEKKEQEAEEARRAEALKPEWERQRRRDIRKELKRLETEGLDSAWTQIKYNLLRDELAALTKF